MREPMILSEAKGRLDLHDVLKRAETIDALFLSELERGLQRLGIGTERTADNRSFEITAVKGKEIFSKRRNERRPGSARRSITTRSKPRSKTRSAKPPLSARWCSPSRRSSQACAPR